MIRQISSADPVTPRRIDPSIPRDLESICLKAMSRNPASRYRLARDMAKDLQRFLQGEPTLARPLGMVEKFRRWFRRDWKLATVVVGAAVTLLCLTAGTTFCLWVLQEKNLQLNTSQVLNETKTAEYLVDASPDALGRALGLLPTRSSHVVDYLQQVADSPEQPANRRFNANLALAACGYGDPATIADLVITQPASPGLLQTMLTVFPDRSPKTNLLIDRLQQRWTEAVQSGRPDDAITDEQFNTAWLHYYLCRGQHNRLPLADICRLDANPSDRTEAIFSVPRWHSNLQSTQTVIANTDDPQIITVILCGLGQMANDGEPRPEGPIRWQTFIEQLRSKHFDQPAVISAASWFSLQHQVPWTEEAAVAYRGGPQSRLSANRYRQVIRELEDQLTMIRIPAGSTLVGVLRKERDQSLNQPHRVTLTQDFMMGDREITAGLFAQFVASKKREDESFSWEAVNSLSTLESHPATNLSWLQAGAFYNWLSRRHDKKPCYTLDKVLEFELPERKIEIPNWVCDPTADGFRLPTEAEFEYAFRAYSQTDFNFGNRRDGVPSLVAFTLFQQGPCRKVGQLMPNGFGLFEMHGNVWEWTGDWHVPLSDQPLVDSSGPKVPNFPADSWYGKTYRGGGVNTRSGEAVSDSRGYRQLDRSYTNLGFRVVAGVSDDQ